MSRARETPAQRRAPHPALAPTRTAAKILDGLASYRLHRDALEMMDMITSTPYDPLDP